MSATHAPEDGLVALPNIPLISLAAIKRAKSTLPCKTPFWPSEIVKLNKISEIANPIKPVITIFFLPILSLSFPQ